MKEMEITAGIIMKNGKILIGQRKFEDKFGGKWEFPGGKIESGELPEDCIVRELKEELNIDIIKFKHFISYIFDFQIIKLVVHSFIISEFNGEIQTNEHECIKWVNIEELKEFDFLDADMKIINELAKKNI